ncbi:MAG: glycosyltransferase [Acidimicrobiales bacterium]
MSSTLNTTGSGPATPSGAALRVQVVLYNQALAEVWKLVPAVGAAARLAIAEGWIEVVNLAFADCSASPVVSPTDAGALSEMAGEAGLGELSYEFLGANRGSAGGSNALAERGTEEYILVLNPDTYPSPRLLARMLARFRDPSIGAVDARQIPLEHPKEFDPATGDTSWVSGSCLMVRRDVYVSVGGFDEENFFLYCDDVDFSWRVRLSGLRTVHAADAVVFHDKRIEAAGTVAATALESHYGGLGRLGLAHKFGRPDLVAETLAQLEASPDEGHHRAAAEWRRRAEAKALPAPLANGTSVANFIEGEYARHRF